MKWLIFLAAVVPLTSMANGQYNNPNQTNQPFTQNYNPTTQRLQNQMSNQQQNQQLKLQQEQQSQRLQQQIQEQRNQAQQRTYQTQPGNQTGPRSSY